jgi:cell division protein FtsB
VRNARAAVVHYDAMPSRERAGTPKPGPDAPRAAPGGLGIAYFILLFVACALVVNAVVGENGLVTMLRARSEHEQLAGQVARARAENARLREEARRLKDDPAAIEAVARRELKLIKPGEKVIIIKDVPAPSAGASRK